MTAGGPAAGKAPSSRPSGRGRRLGCAAARPRHRSGDDRPRARPARPRLPAGAGRLHLLAAATAALEARAGSRGRGRSLRCR